MLNFKLMAVMTIFNYMAMKKDYSVALKYNIKELQQLWFSKIQCMFVKIISATLYTAII